MLDACIMSDMIIICICASRAIVVTLASLHMHLRHQHLLQLQREEMTESDRVNIQYFFSIPLFVKPRVSRYSPKAARFDFLTCKDTCEAR
jgi:hypothetical protein